MTQRAAQVAREDGFQRTSPNARLVDAYYINIKERTASIRGRTAEPSDMLLSCGTGGGSCLPLGSLYAMPAQGGLSAVHTYRSDDTFVSRPDPTLFCRGLNFGAQPPPSRVREFAHMRSLCGSYLFSV